MPGKCGGVDQGSEKACFRIFACVHKSGSSVPQFGGALSLSPIRLWSEARSLQEKIVRSREILLTKPGAQQRECKANACRDWFACEPCAQARARAEVDPISLLLSYKYTRGARYHRDAPGFGTGGCLGHVIGVEQQNVSIEAYGAPTGKLTDRLKIEIPGSLPYRTPCLEIPYRTPCRPSKTQQSNVPEYQSAWTRSSLP